MVAARVEVRHCMAYTMCVCKGCSVVAARVEVWHCVAYTICGCKGYECWCKGCGCWCKGCGCWCKGFSVALRGIQCMGARVASCVPKNIIFDISLMYFRPTSC